MSALDILLDVTGRLQYVRQHATKLPDDADTRATLQALDEMSAELAGKIDSQRRLAS